MNADIPLTQVRSGMFLFLCNDPLLDPRTAGYLFCEPSKVIAIHHGRHPDETDFHREGGMILRATGWAERTGREISLEMTGRGGGRVLVSYPDDQHLVSAINLPDLQSTSIPERPERVAFDPATGTVHDARDLSAYRLPAFWRDASVVWNTLPASWFGRVGWHCELLLFEALSGVRTPATADHRAAEELFRCDTAIGTATLCWENATVVQVVHDRNLRLMVDPLPDPLLEPLLHRLLAALGSPIALRSAALHFIDGRLARSGADPDYLALFIAERDAFAVEVAAQLERKQRGE